MKFKMVKNVIQLAKSSDLNHAFTLCVRDDKKKVLLKEEKDSTFTLSIFYGEWYGNDVYANNIIRKDLTRDQLRCAAEVIQSCNNGGIL